MTKADKTPTMVPKSFQPIRLTSYRLTIMHQSIDWNIRDEVLTGNALHKNPHACRPGKSTTHGLQNLGNRSNESREATELFLDIEGTFTIPAMQASTIMLSESSRQQDIQLDQRDICQKTEISNPSR